jgi:hypothetical protein
MAWYRKSEPEFVYFLGPKEILVKKNERICEELHTEANKIKANLSKSNNDAKPPPKWKQQTIPPKRTSHPYLRL